jgi:hypothetical protein
VAATRAAFLLNFDMCSAGLLNLCKRNSSNAYAVQVDGQIATIQSTLDRRLSSMPPSARQAYSELLAEQAALLAEAGQFEERMAELHGALAAAEGELGRNAFKQRALELQVCVLRVLVTTCACRGMMSDALPQSCSCSAAPPSGSHLAAGSSSSAVAHVGVCCQISQPAPCNAISGTTAIVVSPVQQHR